MTSRCFVESFFDSFTTNIHHHWLLSFQNIHSFIQWFPREDTLEFTDNIQWYTQNDEHKVRWSQWIVPYDDTSKFPVISSDSSIPRCEVRLGLHRQVAWSSENLISDGLAMDLSPAAPHARNVYMEDSFLNENFPGNCHTWTHPSWLSTWTRLLFKKQDMIIEKCALVRYYNYTPWTTKPSTSLESEVSKYIYIDIGAYTVYLFMHLSI